MEKDKKFMQILAVICGALLFKFLGTPEGHYILHISWVAFHIAVLFVAFSFILLFVLKPFELGRWDFFIEELPKVIGGYCIFGVLYYLFFWVLF